MAEPTQADLFSLLPGVKGGRSLAQQRGSEYMRQLGRIGGQTTRDRYGITYFRELGRIGRQIWRDRRNKRIRLIRFAPDEQHRIIPFFPAGRRRVSAPASTSISPDRAWVHHNLPHFFKETERVGA